MRVEQSHQNQSSTVAKLDRHRPTIHLVQHLTIIDRRANQLDRLLDIELGDRQRNLGTGIDHFERG